MAHYELLRGPLRGLTKGATEKTGYRLQSKVKVGDTQLTLIHVGKPLTKVQQDLSKLDQLQPQFLFVKFSCLLLDASPIS